MKSRSQRALLILLVFQLISVVSMAQERATLAGQVFDDTGEALPGATVLIEGTSEGTITDFEGNYSISVPLNATVKVSFVGYDVSTFTYTGQSNQNITLQMDVQQMEEIVVIGYGSVKKSDVTGSVASVDTEALQRIASIDVSQGLQGAVAGVQVSSNSGAPGAGGSNIRVRGVGSMAASDPLFVVDGFITDDLSNISPSDIASMEVLKDASATAVYGSRGANGVILVTTKRAAEGKLRVDVNAYYGFQNVANKYDVLNAEEYAQAYLISLYGEESTIDNMPDGPNKDWISGALDGSIEGTDWQEEMTRTAPILNTELNLSGGSEKVSYKLGGLFFSQDGTLVDTYSDRYQFNAGVKVKPIKMITLDASVRYSNNEYLGYNSSIYSSIMATAVRKEPLPSPMLPGDPSIFNDSRITDIGSPALAAFNQKADITTETRVNANAKLTVDITPSLSFNTVFAYDQKGIDRVQDTPEYSTVNQFNQRNAAGDYILIPNASNDSAFSYTDIISITVLQSSNYFNYSKTIGSHSFGIDLGQEYYRNVYDPTPGQEGAIANPNEFRLLSGFVRANYNYDDRYLLTGTFRRDGSSKFHEDYRWGDFASFSLGWNVGNEAFFPQNDIVSGLKFRGGWGQIGNQNPVAPYQYLALLESGENYSLDNATASDGIAGNKLSNPALQWETSQMLNVAADVLFLEDKISLTAEYFIKDTKDLLVPSIPTPNFAGAQGPSSNAATMSNTGIELSLDYKQVFGDFTLNVGGNFTRIVNEVVSLGAIEGSETDYIEGGTSETKINLPATRTKVGENFASFYGRNILGVFQSDGAADAHRGVDANGTPIDNQGNTLSNVDPTTYMGTTATGEVAEQALLQRKAAQGDYMYQDVNFDGRIDENDVVNLGSAIPDFTYGGYVNANYKQFDLSVSIIGSQGAEAANIFKYYTEGNSASIDNITRDRFDNRWTSTNPNGGGAILSASAAGGNDDFSSRYVEDASYLRIRNVQFGWSMPATMLSKLKLQRCRLYISMDNLATFTKYSGLNPDVGIGNGNSFSPGVDYFNYPIAKTMIFGTSITF